MKSRDDSIWKTKKHSKWIICPVCKNETRTKIYPDTVLIHFPLYCPSCKREIPITLVDQKLVINKALE